MIVEKGWGSSWVASSQKKNVDLVEARYLSTKIKEEKLYDMCLLRYYTLIIFRWVRDVEKILSIAIKFLKSNNF